jgi:hypothetical protein
MNYSEEDTFDALVKCSWQEAARHFNWYLIYEISGKQVCWMPSFLINGQYKGWTDETIGIFLRKLTND